MRYLLDTSALLAHFRQEAGWEAVQVLFETGEVELFLATVTLAEFGRRLRELGATEQEIEDTLASYELLFTKIIPIDIAVAKSAFTIGCQTPRRLPLVDALIAAASQGIGATLVHRDEHMHAIPSQLLNQQYLAS